MIAGAKPAVDADKAADVPLSKEEALEMRGHLRFLKEHRKVLALKVNAAEDLLLNGVREPTHRGVCQHLLDKVERSRVEAVAQRLGPAARVRLLEGVLGFAPDVAYVLLYLESLRDAAREEATPALSAALKRIDFAAISAAQMRRVLDLIVELYDARDRPQLMFSLLQSATFRAAFDDSAAALPAPLAEVVLPLRAVHAVVLRGKKNPFDAASLARGVAMLLQGRAKVLRAQSASTRSRLFDAGIDLCTERECAPGLLGLVDGFEPGERSTSEAMLRLAGWLLARGLEPDAKKLLARLSKEHPGFKLPQRWLTALEGPRIGGAGLAAAPGRGRDFWQEGMLLARQLPVWVSVGKPDAAPRFANAAALAESIAVPGVARVLESGTTRDGAPYWITPRLGRGGNELLGKQELAASDVSALCAEAVRILSSLADAGVRLPDARFRRFSVDPSGRLWLRDLLDAERATPEDARPAHLELARQFCSDAYDRVKGTLSDDPSSAETFAALVRLVEGGG